MHTVKNRIKKDHWFDPLPRQFDKKDKDTTTILFGGLTIAHDYLLEGALKGIGYHVQHLSTPDAEALRYGKEFGNRGQCNPTYFTVGNLIKHLKELHQQGKSKEDIIGNYLFVTSGSCGPCRFGTYVTEYRKALRDAGYDGFRVLLFQQQSGLKQATGNESALKLDSTFFIRVLKAIFIGDILNLIGYRIRPYEMEKGATNQALERCKHNLHEALRSRKQLIPVLLQCRKEFSSIRVDQTRIKPKVSIIGEFWAMTTEGDGSYHLQNFLESEGAEVDIQSVTSWILYLIWEGRFDTQKRMYLRGTDSGRYGLKGKNPIHRLRLLFIADKTIRVLFQFYAKIIGLHGYHLPNMNQIAEAAHTYYNNHLRGGEGHMEVGKLILNVVKKKVNMTVSIKPFGCLPSSGVSDGIQSMITEMYPEAIFLPIETTGDGAVNVYSRIQMMLFKAKQAANKEFHQALKEKGITENQLKNALNPSKGNISIIPLKHKAACTAANVVYNANNKINIFNWWYLFEKRKKEIKET